MLPLHTRALGTQAYAETFAAMQAFTTARDAHTSDEVWLVQHPPVYTLGRNAKHGAPAGAIPVVHSDRGGDITYHGPGQIVLYVLIDLARRGLGVRELVAQLEQSVLDLLCDADIDGARRAGAPGVYVDGRKLAALGLRVRRGCSYHGLALNVDMDLAPFRAIAPCGYENLDVTQLRDLGIAVDPTTAGAQLRAHLMRNLGYNAGAVTGDTAGGLSG